MTPALALSGKELYDNCRAYPNDGQTASCEFAVSSFMDIVREDDKLGNPRGRLCIGKEVPVSEVIAIVTAWLAEHPELLDRRAYDAIYQPMANRYRCK